MKSLKLLSLALFAVVAFTISSCSTDDYVVPFTISAIDNDVVGSMNDSEIVGKFNITNNTGEQLTLRWVRQNESFPAGWESAICDHILCYDRALSERDLVLDANATEEIKFNFYPEGVSGSGTADLVIFDPANQELSTETVSFSALARQ